MKKILVIGGMGYIGSHTVVELISAGYAPIIIDNLSNSDMSVLKGIEAIAGQKVPFYKCDFANMKQMKQILKNENIDGIIHFAAHKAVGESVIDPLKYYSNNVAKFIKLLQLVQDIGLQTFVFSSSAAVYGIPLTSKVTEDSICSPSSPYGNSKLIDETLLRDLCATVSDLNGTALRYFNVVGSHSSALIGELPKGTPQNLLPIIVYSILGKIKPFTIYGTDYDTPDGTCLRDYIHVVDLAKAHIKALELKAGYHVYNIGTGKPTSVLELVTAFEKINKVKANYKLGERRLGDQAACYAGVSLAEKELGWQATKTIEDAVRDAWVWGKKSLVHSRK